MNPYLKSALALTAVAVASQAMAQVTFFEQDNFRGRSFTTESQVGNFERSGFNDRASSVVVARDSWEVCESAQFGGRCTVLQPGQYPSLAAMGLNDRVSSVRTARNNAPSAVTPQVTFYENEGFGGRSFLTDKQVNNFARNQFNDRASSVVVVGGPWELCENNQFKGRCVVLRAGQYPSMSAMRLNDRVSSVRLASREARADEDRYAPATASGQVTFYEGNGFKGRSFTTVQAIDNFVQNNFNDRASSVVVTGNPWELCENVRYSGRCVVLRPGQYPTMASMGLNDRVSSVRAVSRDARNDDNRHVPAAAPDYRQRNNERLFEANVTSVRAVVGTPEQRCWVEPGQVAQTQGNTNLPAAIAGALIGGILGHQVGGGTGKDVATAGGALAGAAIGANMGRSGQPTASQDIQRCESTPNRAQPQYWDVSYNFRGQEHRTQMTAPPGATVTVNAQGEPRN